MCVYVLPETIRTPISRVKEQSRPGTINTPLRRAESEKGVFLEMGTTIGVE
jgi:hypothetical protein